MKTTIDLPDSLLAEARKLAAARSTTVRALMEAGLRKELRERASSRGFHLRDASFKGKGLRQAVAGARWERVRELAYAERGG